MEGKADVKEDIVQPKLQQKNYSWSSIVKSLIAGGIAGGV
jgi:hypothetical protein